MSWQIVQGDAVDLLAEWTLARPSLIATDPPYAFSGEGAEHALSATVAVALRESARLLRPGGWMVVFAASSWRSTAYMVEATRGLLTPVRIATWVKPKPRSKVRTPGWAWASVNVIALRKGKSTIGVPTDAPDWIEAEPMIEGRRAQLPDPVAEWAVSPFAEGGGVMLDPFAGSGALCRAASGRGMTAVGFEVRV